jgi:hypothetical protein
MTDLRDFMPLAMLGTRPVPRAWTLLAAAALAAMVPASSASARHSQTITVQFVNGRSGKPLARIKVYIGFGNPKTAQPIVLVTDRRGELRFSPGRAETFQVHPVALVACGEQPKGAPYRNYSAATVLRTGIVTPNSCGPARAERVPGRLVYFARPASWWELFRN